MSPRAKRPANPTRITGTRDFRTFRWVVELEVAECWVADGYNPDDEDILMMLATRLGWADFGRELGARVLRRPDQAEVRRVQGFHDEVTAAGDAPALHHDEIMRVKP